MIRSNTVPVSMQASPIHRIVESSTWSSVISMRRQRPGAMKGKMPSMTSIKQNAIASSCHIVRILMRPRIASKLASGFAFAYVLAYAIANHRPETNQADSCSSSNQPGLLFLWYLFLYSQSASDYWTPAPFLRYLK